jgi:hypothetical protein
MSSSPNQSGDEQPETLVVSASTLSSLLAKTFPSMYSVKAVVFEAGLELREIPPYFFGPFGSVESICIPASVEVIRKKAFHHHKWNEPCLKTLTFEAGSKLQRIETLAFFGCSSLKSICLPASVTEIGGGAFCKSGIREISLEAGNRNFVVVDGFLMDFERICVIQYFGCESDLMIPSSVEILRTFSFLCFGCLRTVKFSPGTKIRSIESWAFAFCTSLSSICIPASVDFIGTKCFASCKALSVVEFEAGSKLRELQANTFEECLLRLITIPSSVETLGPGCFLSCFEVETITFLPDSKLVPLEQLVFAHCVVLSSLFIPPLVEFIGIDCFWYCSSLSILTFGSPTRIRELLDLPPDWFGFHSIPDSVEHLGFDRICPAGQHCVLTFSHESKLARLTRLEWKPGSRYRSSLQISSRSLSVIRRNLEFAELGI